MTESYRKCSHCKGTGICHVCKGTGRLALQKGKTLHILLSARQRQVPELPRPGRIRQVRKACCASEPG